MVQYPEVGLQVSPAVEIEQGSRESTSSSARKMKAEQPLKKRTGSLMAVGVL